MRKDYKTIDPAYGSIIGRIVFHIRKAGFFTKRRSQKNGRAEESNGGGCVALLYGEALEQQHAAEQIYRAGEHP